MANNIVGEREKLGGVYPEELQSFRDRTKVGERLNCLIPDFDGIFKNGFIEVPGVCTVRSKYTHHAVTDRGSFQWAELLLQNRSKTREKRR